jgi:hypothetical protein
MNFLKNLLTGIYDWLKNTVMPPNAFSWQTLIFLSLFSYGMSWLASGVVEWLLANLAWIFLILGVYWGTTATKFFWIGRDEKKKKPGFPISAWITGALVSIYIFGLDGELTSVALVSWPIISAIVFAIPLFLGEKLSLKLPPADMRQNLAILFGSQLLLSCWLQFYFVIQGWLTDYPSLAADNFSQSAFVVNLETTSVTMPRGVSILNAIESNLEAQIDGIPWSKTERLLLPQEREDLINNLERQAKQQLATAEEDNLWQVTSGVSARDSGYNLQLQAIWNGPRGGAQGNYTITKTCQVTPEVPPVTAATDPTDARAATISSPVSNVECEKVRGWGVNEPIIASN